MSGSSLIEMMLCCMLSSIFLLCSTRSVLHLYNFCCVQIHREDELIQLACGLTTVSNDLRRATYVDVEGTERLVGKVSGVEYCWYIKKGLLIRSSGRYDKSTQEFSRNAHSLLASGITSCAYVGERQQGRIRGVWCTLTSAHHTMSLYTTVGGFFDE